MSSIGYRISKARRYANMNQKELAKKAGITEGSLSRYENDIREPKVGALKLLAEALDVSIEYLVGSTDVIEKKSVALENKIDMDVEDIMYIIYEVFEQKNVSYKDKKLSKDKIDEVLFAMKIGMKIAIEEFS